MRYTTLIIVLIIVYFLFEFLVFYYKYNRLPTLVENKQPEQILGHGEKLKYLAMGDSTAVGLGASEISNTYTYKIAKTLSTNYEVNYKNIGVVGAKTEDIINNQLEQATDFKPDVVTISIGGNDATHLVSPKKVMENLNSIIERITKETSAKIYLTDTPNFKWATVLPWFYRKLLETRSQSLNKKIKEIEIKRNDGRVKIVNIHDFGWSSFPDLSKTNAKDNFHPNDLGYQNWTNAFLDRMKTDL